MCKIYQSYKCQKSFEIKSDLIFFPQGWIQMIDVTNWKAAALLSEHIGHSSQRVIIRECVRAYA